MLSKEDVLKIAALSKLEFSESEIEKFRVDLNKIVEHMEEWNGVDTTDGEPLFKDVTVDYEVSESGVLKPNTAAAIPIKITKEQEEKMKGMNDSSKAKMSFNDFKFKDK